MLKRWCQNVKIKEFCYMGLKHDVFKMLIFNKYINYLIYEKYRIKIMVTKAIKKKK